jgi:hypothetical protein
MSRKKKRKGAAAAPGAAEFPLTAEVTMTVTGAVTAPVARNAPAGGPRDILNRPVDSLHREFLDLYLRTKVLCVRKDLPPYASRNLKKSLACLYQIVNDGGVVYEHLYDIGV